MDTTPSVVHSLAHFDISGEKILFVSSYDLLNEISDDKRFRKNINANLMQVRNAVKDGLFTADIPGEEENWGIARTLLSHLRSLPIVLSRRRSSSRSLLQPGKRSRNVRWYDGHNFSAAAEMGAVSSPTLRLFNARSQTLPKVWTIRGH